MERGCRQDLRHPPRRGDRQAVRGADHPASGCSGDYRSRFESNVASGGTDRLGHWIEFVGQRADGSEFPVEVAITRIDAEPGPLRQPSARHLGARRARREARRGKPLARGGRAALPNASREPAVDHLPGGPRLRRRLGVHLAPGRGGARLHARGVDVGSGLLGAQDAPRRPRPGDQRGEPVHRRGHRARRRVPALSPQRRHRLGPRPRFGRRPSSDSGRQMVEGLLCGHHRPQDAPRSSCATWSTTTTSPASTTAAASSAS